MILVFLIGLHPAALYQVACCLGRRDRKMICQVRPILSESLRDLLLLNIHVNLVKAPSSNIYLVKAQNFC